MLELCTLASGSSGNSLLVTDGRTHVLVDAGISCRRICTGLKGRGAEGARRRADHPRAQRPHLRFDHPDQAACCRCMPARDGRQLCYRIAFLEELLRPVAGEGFSVGGLAIESFPPPRRGGERGLRPSAGGGRRRWSPTWAM